MNIAEYIKYQAIVGTSSSLPVDTNGSILASVLPRTDSIANLTTASVSGLGEIAYPNNLPASTGGFIQFAGNAGSGVAYQFSPMKFGTWNYTTSTLNGFPDLNILCGVLGGLSLQSGNATTDGTSSGNINITDGSAGGSGANQGTGNLTITVPPAKGSASGGFATINVPLHPTNPVNSPIFVVDAGINIAFGVQDAGNTGGTNGQVALGFFGTFAEQQTIAKAGTAGTTPINIGSPLMTGATFNGVGSGSAYTINQIVSALKHYGLLAA